MRLKLLEPLEGNVQPAKRRVRIAQLLVAVPVRPAADGHAETLRNSGEPALRAGRMARVPHLEAVETLLAELPDLALGALVPEARGHRDPPHRMHQLPDLPQGRQRPPPTPPP